MLVLSKAGPILPERGFEVKSGLESQGGAFKLGERVFGRLLSSRKPMMASLAHGH